MDDKSFTIRVPRHWARIAGIVGVTILIVEPLTAVATHSFNHVPDSNTFHDDIAWMKDADVTRGCPPTNTQYCPDDIVSRGQMAAFMKRLAGNQVVDAATVGGMSPGEIGSVGVAGSSTAMSLGQNIEFQNIDAFTQITVPAGQTATVIARYSAEAVCNLAWPSRLQASDSY